MFFKKKKSFYTIQGMQIQFVQRVWHILSKTKQYKKEFVIL